MSVITVAMDFVLAYIIDYLTVNERHETKSEELHSLVLKNVIAQFLNTAFMYYVLFLVFDAKHMGLNGVIEQVMSLVTVSGVIKIAKNALQVGECYHKYQTSPFKKMAEHNPPKPIKMFQVQLNQQLQMPEFNFVERYSEYIVLTFIVTFYATLTPLATPLLAVIFFVQYWVDKCNLLRRFSCPINFSYQLTLLTLVIFQFVVPLLTIGNFLFKPYINEEGHSAFDIIALVLSLAYIVAVLVTPKNWEEKIYQFSETEVKTYSHCLKKKCFARCYWRSNPGTAFAREEDLNKPGTYVDYGYNFELA